MAEINKLDSGVLLVEAESDRGLFEQIFKTLPLKPKIQVACPRDLNPKSKNGKQAVLNLTAILLKQIADAATAEPSRLAVILDADYATEGGLGFSKTLKQFAEKVGNHGYVLVGDVIDNGLIFRHSEDLPDIGLWVMPNNNSDGMLEDWLKACVHNNEQTLFNHAQTVVAALEPKKFKPIHQTKAEVASWLAWQDEPGHGLYQAQRGGLLDESKPLYNQLITWLTKIYV